MNPTLDINILKFENWQSLVPGLVCDLPRCVERPLCNALKYEFLRGIIAYKQLRMLMLQKKKKQRIIFYFQSSTNFHTNLAPKLSAMSIRHVPPVIGNF